MNIGDILYPALGALVSNRAWPDEAPEEAAVPFIVFRQADLRIFDTVDRLAAVTVLEGYAIDIWGSSRGEVLTLANQAMAAMTALDGAATMRNTFNGLGWDFDPITGLHAAVLNYSIPNTI